MPTIILSYRRDDTGWIAGRVFDRLAGHYGSDQVFMDIDSIPFGLDFREHIQESLKRCDILLAIVGPRWAAPNEQGRLRISDETDWVRIEIEAALAKNIPVIPVLIDGIALPSPAELPQGLRDLAFRQAAPVDSGRDFHPHMDRLIKAMDQLLSRANPAVPPEAPKAATKSTEASVTKPKDGPAVAAKLLDVPAAADKTVVATPASRARSLLWSGLRALMTPPNGRIDRKTFWIAAMAAVLFTVGFFLITAYAIGALLGVTDPAILVGSVVIGLAVWTWSTAAVGGKRLHDRNRTALWMAIPIAWQFLFAWAMVAKFGPRNLDIIGTTMLLGSPIALWVLIDLGVLKGTPGPNQFGPDPLGQKQSDPTP
jgi:uncharacterized membrane protein YhaH (DUF805 family)